MKRKRQFFMLVHLEELHLPASNSKVTLFHQKILAHELTLKRPAHELRKLNQTLASSTVDLNPRQIDAALFAFNCPLSRGAILCDEVGLGKTIEVGLIISQLWAEGKRKIIIVVPASLRKQWQNELFEKFNIPGVIVDGSEYKTSKKDALNPFDRDNLAVIVSTPFAFPKRIKSK
ncbi:MAG: helicase subunit of dna repair complex [Candidatus Brocadia fulgida]|uniref:Helicase subunit of dna repair complex n=1 Tax=Candidatus Brocadia fulgida TaxID=380242 RepID=A0A0M2UVL3_9BACT|nr:MAG: helicase subunit of dna repair complex [Candidatus Brocadia fulgida]